MAGAFCLLSGTFHVAAMVVFYSRLSKEVCDFLMKVCDLLMIF